MGRSWRFSADFRSSYRPGQKVTRRVPSPPAAPDVGHGYGVACHSYHTTTGDGKPQGPYAATHTWGRGSCTQERTQAADHQVPRETRLQNHTTGLGTGAATMWDWEGMVEGRRATCGVPGNQDASASLCVSRSLSRCSVRSTYKPRTVRMKMVASARLQKGCSWSHLSAAKPGLKSAAPTVPP